MWHSIYFLMPWNFLEDLWLINPSNSPKLHLFRSAKLSPTIHNNSLHKYLISETDSLKNWLHTILQTSLAKKYSQNWVSSNGLINSKNRFQMPNFLRNNKSKKKETKLIWVSFLLFFGMDNLRDSTLYILTLSSKNLCHFAINIFLFLISCMKVHTPT